jgi:hypothetical protein
MAFRVLLNAPDDGNVPSGHSLSLVSVILRPPLGARALQYTMVVRTGAEHVLELRR